MAVLLLDLPIFKLIFIYSGSVELARNGIPVVPNS